MNVWVDQIEFLFRAVGFPNALWVSGLLSRVYYAAWSEMKLHLDNSDLQTSSESFVSQRGTFQTRGSFSV